MSMLTETVAAISTPYGKGGIATIRISGSDALPVAQRVFLPKNQKPLGENPPRKVLFGAIFADGVQIDTGVAVYFAAPHSFTGEDTVEISCHGGILLTQMVLESVFAAGAVPAPAGEFTRRAFENGKLDLVQAEAVIDLIDAQSREKIKLASANSQGVFSRATAQIREELSTLLASTCAAVDFPDEDLTTVDAAELADRLQQLDAHLADLLATYRAGHAIAEGIPTILLGKPNTGKSSLLNAFLGEERAIVTAEAGTTRDTIEETVCVGRVQLRLCDTAGIRRAQGAEGMGVARAKEKLKEAELVLAVFDANAPLDAQDAEIFDLLTEAHARQSTVLAVLNKSDLPMCLCEAELAAHLPEGTPLVLCSAKQDIGALREQIEALYQTGTLAYGDAIVSNARHFAALTRTREAVFRAREALKAGFTQDVAGFDLQDALGALCEVDGRAVSEEIVSGIFARFCVGK